MSTDSTFLLESSTDRVMIDRASGRLVSLRVNLEPGQEMICPSPEHPVFLLQYIDADGEYQQLDSRGAGGFSAEAETAPGTGSVVLRFTRVGGLDLDVTVTARASADAPGSRWSVTVRNGAGLRIVDLQYPVVVSPYALAGAGGARASETVVVPHDFGRVMRAPTFESLGPDAPSAWHFVGRNGSWNHYPGGQFAQFIAYHNDKAGLLLWTRDTQGHVKRFRALHRTPGIRLGVAHVGDWPAAGERTLPYDTVLTGFTGDWREAASIYRDWSLQQHWATPIHRRTDMPSWLLDSPVHVTIRPQGVLDAGPVEPVKEFLPYEKCVPLLERIAKAVEAPLVAVIMGWERAGSWVYPDCFPPIGGDASVAAFAKACAERGWRTGSFCNGTRWVLGHNWNGYDGRPYFKEHDGASSVCREPGGAGWQETWDVHWRPSLVQCSSAPVTKRIALDFVKRLLSWGLTSIQFFDQNCGAATFPCFSADHGHPAAPGRWMSDAMKELVDSFNRAAREAGADQAIQSVEMCCNEHELQVFQQSDSRVRPPGHVVEVGDVIPLYQFLFHECIVMHGMMSPGPEPWHLEIANAANGVQGEIPGGVLTGRGTLLDKDTYNWAPWDPVVGDPDRGLAMIRSVTALRRGAGHDWLVLGRMQKPVTADGIPVVRWDWQGKQRAIPAVFHEAWQAPDGRFAVALANWSEKPVKVSLRDERLGRQVTVRAEDGAAKTLPVRGGAAAVSVAPLSMVMAEAT